jgi:hypothetical protein
VKDVVKATFGAQTASPYEAEIAKSIERVVVDRLMDTVADARMPQVRAIAQGALAGIAKLGGDANRDLMALDIERFNDRALAAPLATMPAVPPGAPIGDPGMNHLFRMIEPVCSQDTSTFALRGRR